MRMLTGLLFVAYLVLLGAKAEVPVATAHPDLAFVLEVALDAVVIALAARRRYFLVLVSFVATLVSTSNFQILSRFFGIKLPDTMGTWLEIEINIPYITCYAAGALVLFRWAPDSGRRWAVPAGAMIALVSLGGTLAWLLPGLMRTGYPAQNRVLHVMCFAVSAIIYGFGAVNVVPGEARGRALIALGYLSIAFSGLLFQITEIFPRVYAFDVPMDLTWTLGQFAVIYGLLLEEPEEPAKS